MLSTDQKKPPAKKPDAVSKLQEYAKKKAAEEAEAKKKKKEGVKTAPSSGVLGRMYDFVTGKMTGTEKK